MGIMAPPDVEGRYERGQLSSAECVADVCRIMDSASTSAEQAREGIAEAQVIHVKSQTSSNRRHDFGSTNRPGVLTEGNKVSDDHLPRARNGAPEFGNQILQRVIDGPVYHEQFDTSRVHWKIWSS